MSYNKRFIYKLKDETELLIRQVNPDDKLCLQNGFAKLSIEAVFTRFLTPIKFLTPAYLTYLTEVDQKNHVAWCAFYSSDVETFGVGTCRFIRLKDSPEKAEFAITVINQFQNRGLGSIFLALLYLLASYHDISLFWGIAVNTNSRFIKNLVKLGAKSEWKSGECQLDLPIYKNYKDIPKNEYSGHFTDLLKAIESHLFERI